VEFMWKDVESMWSVMDSIVGVCGIHVVMCGIHVVVVCGIYGVMCGMEPFHLECGGRVNYWNGCILNQPFLLALADTASPFNVVGRVAKNSTRVGI